MIKMQVKFYDYTFNTLDCLETLEPKTKKRNMGADESKPSDTSDDDYRHEDDHLWLPAEKVIEPTSDMRPFPNKFWEQHSNDNNTFNMIANVMMVVRNLRPGTLVETSNFENSNNVGGIEEVLDYARSNNLHILKQNNGAFPRYLITRNCVRSDLANEATYIPEVMMGKYLGFLCTGDRFGDYMIDRVALHIGIPSLNIEFYTEVCEDSKRSEARIREHGAILQQGYQTLFDEDTFKVVATIRKIPSKLKLLRTLQLAETDSDNLVDIEDCFANVGMDKSKIGDMLISISKGDYTDLNKYKRNRLFITWLFDALTVRNEYFYTNFALAFNSKKDMDENNIRLNNFSDELFDLVDKYIDITSKIFMDQFINYYG